MWKLIQSSSKLGLRDDWMSLRWIQQNSESILTGEVTKFVSYRLSHMPQIVIYIRSLFSPAISLRTPTVPYTSRESWQAVGASVCTRWLFKAAELYAGGPLWRVIWISSLLDDIGGRTANKKQWSLSRGLCWASRRAANQRRGLWWLGKLEYKHTQEARCIKTYKLLSCTKSYVDGSIYGSMSASFIFLHIYCPSAASAGWNGRVVFFLFHFVPKLSFRSKIKIDKLHSLKAQMPVFLVFSEKPF